MRRTNRSAVFCLAVLLLGLLQIAGTQSESHTSDMADLYLIAGFPWANQWAPLTAPSRLFEMSEGKLEQVRTLFPAQVGTMVVLPFFACRKVVVCRWYYRGRNLIIDMDRPSEVTEFEVSDTAGGYSGPWLLSRGPMVCLFGLTLIPHDQRNLRYVGLDLGIPNKFEELPSSIFGKSVRVYGPSWLEEQGSWFDPRVSSDGRLLFRSYPDFPPLGPPVPEELRGTKATLIVDVRDGKWMDLRALEGPTADHGSVQLFIWDESKTQWRKGPKLEGDRPFVRGFGNDWLGIAIARQVPRQPQPSKIPSTPAGVPAKYIFADNGVQLPGKLIAYNMKTRRQLTITTNVADSEIILIGNNQIVYRSEDKLYKAPIGEQGLGEPELLVEDENILAAHWAFFGPAE